MENNNPKEIWNKINESKKIIASLHSNPDGDSFASCLAMKYFLEKREKQVTIISHDEISKELAEMKMAEEIEFEKDITDVNLNQFDILLAIDTPTPEMTGKFKVNYKIPKEIFVINIDHHANNPLYGNINYIDSSQPSACSVLLEIFKKEKIKFDSELSTRLLLGLCTDSGFFSFAPDAEKALLQAAFLIKNGGKYLDRIVKPLLHNRSLNLMKYYSLLIEKVTSSVG